MRERSACASNTLSKGARMRGGCRGVGVGQWRAGQVEELAAAIIRVDRKPVAQACDRGGELRQAAPSLDVRDARGTECGEVADDHRLEVGAVIEAACQPGLARHPARLTAEPPEAARGHLNGRTENGGRLRERRRINPRPVSREEVADLPAGERSVRQVPARGSGERIEVQVAQRPAERARAEAALEHRSHEWPQQRPVALADEMDGATHQHATDRAAVGNKL